MAKKTTLVYLDQYKERLREAFGKFSGAAESYDPAAEDGSEQKDKLTDLKQEVEGILAEPTPSDLVEEDPTPPAPSAPPPTEPPAPPITPTPPPTSEPPK